MIYIVQSYSAPNSIGDGDLFDHLTKHFGGDVTAVPAISDKVRGFTAKEYFKTGVATYKRLKDYDVMFGWGGDLCLYAWLRGIFGVKKVKYLSQNLIFNPEDTSLKQRIRGLLYRIAFKSKNFFATVNSPELKEFYAKTFHCSKDKFYTVLDAMDESDIESLSTSDTGNRGGYIFFGGKQNRDIPTFIEVVKSLPNVKFVAILRKSSVMPEMMHLPNLQVLSDVSKDRFFSILFNASVCCIPLNAMSPCGVSVMQQAILKDVPIVSTDTPSMRVLVPNANYGFLLPRGDAKGMAEKINLLLKDKRIKETITRNAKENMKSMTHEEIDKQIISALDYVIGK